MKKIDNPTNNLKKEKIEQMISSYLVLFTIFTIALIPTAFAHEPDFEGRTPDEILKLCNFFYEEYLLIGSENFKDHHKLFLNAKICPILFEHIAWNSQHPQKDLVLINEIEKKLNENSSYLKDKHIEGLSSVPKEFQNKANLWMDSQINDKEFLSVIKEFLNLKMINHEEIKYERICSDAISCLKEDDYLEYVSTNTKGEEQHIKFEVQEIKSNETIIEMELNSISEESKKITLDKNRKFTEKIGCCQMERLIYTIPYQTNQIIEDDFLVIENTNYSLDSQVREAIIAEDQEGKQIILDKKTGSILSMKFNDIESSEISLSGTNIFENSMLIETEKSEIPDWFEKNTKWYIDEIITEEEYLNSIKYLINLY